MSPAVAVPVNVLIAAFATSVTAVATPDTAAATELNTGAITVETGTGTDAVGTGTDAVGALGVTNSSNSEDKMGVVESQLNILSYLNAFFNSCVLTSSVTPLYIMSL